MKARLLLPALLAAGFAGCSVKSVALNTASHMIGKGSEAFYEESDWQLAETGMASQLKLLEALLKNDPENVEIAAYTAQAFGGYAFLFVEESDPARARRFYQRGRDHGLKVLNRRLSNAFEQGADLERLDGALKKIGPAEAPLLFWTAYCWGNLANLSLDDPQSLADLPKVERLMLRVRDVAPKTFYGGPDLFLGAYYGARPKMFGGDLKKSKSHFDAALKLGENKFLLTQVMCAQHYAIPAQNREFFKSLLEEVAAFPAESFPEQRLTNESAKRRAKKLLEDIDEFF